MKYLLFVIFIIPMLAHSEPSSKEIYDLMSPDEKSALKAIVHYRGTVTQAYYCMAAFPDLSKEISNTLSQFQTAFAQKYEQSQLKLMQIIITKPNAMSALTDHIGRIHASEKARLTTMGSPGISIPELCQQYAKEPQTVMAVTHEYMGQ